MSYGNQLKEEGQALALEHAGVPWRERAIDLLRRYCRSVEPREEFAFEDFRAWATACGLENPPSSNAWGSLPRIAIRDGLMRPTGRYRPAFSPMTHAHPVRLYVSGVSK